MCWIRTTLLFRRSANTEGFTTKLAYRGDIWELTVLVRPISLVAGTVSWGLKNEYSFVCYKWREWERETGTLGWGRGEG